MCGITGIVNYKMNLLNNLEDIELMNNSLRLTGSDSEEGYYSEKNVLFGYKGRDNNKQPITTKEYSSYTIICNGTLYNSNIVKNELLKNGFTFENNSDAEILLKAYIHFGYDMVNKLNGVYSFAIWNSKKEELFLVRDRFGIKPLYYALINDSLIFASEVKALLKYKEVEIILDSCRHF